MKFALGLAAAAALAGPAAAHVVITPVHADKNTYVVGSFRVGHGCNGAATTEIRIEIPDGLTSVKPRPLPGWTVQTVKQGETVTEVVWTGGPLPDDQFQIFDLSMKTPDAGAMLYFPVTQVCGAQRQAWDEIPAPGASGDGLAHPAPSLHVGPISEMPGHDMSTHGAMDHSGHAATPATDHSAHGAAPAAAAPAAGGEHDHH